MVSSLLTTLANELTNNFGYTSIGTAVIVHKTVFVTIKHFDVLSKGLSGG